MTYTTAHIHKHNDTHKHTAPKVHSTAHTRSGEAHTRPLPGTNLSYLAPCSAHIHAHTHGHTHTLTHPHPYKHPHTPTPTPTHTRTDTQEHTNTYLRRIHTGTANKGRENPPRSARTPRTHSPSISCHRSSKGPPSDRRALSDSPCPPAALKRHPGAVRLARRCACQPCASGAAAASGSPIAQTPATVRTVHDHTHGCHCHFIFKRF